MKYTISKDRRFLTITVDAEERAELREFPENCDNGERVSIHSDAAMVDFLQPITCNSELQWMNASETGDLTDAPILGIYGAGPDDQAQVVSERWGFEPYAVRSLLEDLRDKGEVVLSNAW